MAEEQENVAAEGDADESGPAKGSSKKWFIVVGIVLILLGGGGFAGWHFFLSERPSDENSQEVAEAKEAAPEVRLIHEMKPYIVNLLGQGGKRYLKAKVELEVGNEGSLEELKIRRPEVRDAILLLLASKTFDDISTPEGKAQLRSELVMRVNQILKEGSIRALYFTDFVVQ